MLLFLKSHMKSYFKALWVVTLVLLLSPPAFAVKCYMCGDEESPAIQCGKLPQNQNSEHHKKCHEICKDCALNQVNSALGDGSQKVREIHDQGLPCFGDEAKCKERFAMEAVKQLLTGTDALKA